MLCWWPLWQCSWVLCAVQFIYILAFFNLSLIVHSDVSFAEATFESLDCHFANATALSQSATVRYEPRWVVAFSFYLLQCFSKCAIKLSHLYQDFDCRSIFKLSFEREKITFQLGRDKNICFPSLAPDTRFRLIFSYSFKNGFQFQDIFDSIFNPRERGWQGLMVCSTFLTPLTLSSSFGNLLNQSTRVTIRVLDLQL